jgi:integrase
MAKQVRELALATRTARMRLVGQKRPYFRAVSDGLHLGYRRSTLPRKAGTWLARRYLGSERYEMHHLGTADDFADMPVAAAVLTFDEALSAAKDWARAQINNDRAEAAPSVTVRAGLLTYVAARKARNAAAGRDAELRLGHHVLAADLADRPLLALTDADLERWRAGVARGGRGKPSKAPLAPATLARLLNDLRAALSAAARKARAPADLLATIRDGLRAPEKHDRARAKQVLPDADVRKVIAAAAAHDADFGALVMVLAATGARLDQVSRITVADFQAAARRVMVPVSRKGRGEKQVSHLAVPLPDDVIARLSPLAAGRAGHEALLLHWHHHQVKGENVAGKLPAWERVDRRPWTMAASMSRPWRAAVAAAGQSADLVPYCLRHSSIVRGLRAGLPVRLVAAVHDTSVAMIEKHYSAFVVDAAEDLLRRALVPMAPVTIVVRPPVRE